MAIPVVLRGDTSAEIPLVLADGYNYDGCKLVVEYCGISREFTGLVAGGNVKVRYSAEETAQMPLGTSNVLLSLINAKGEKQSLPFAKLKMTDSPGEVYDVPIVVDPGLMGIESLPTRFNDEDVRNRVNAIIAWMKRGVSAVVLAALPVFGSGLTVQTAPKGQVYNDQPIVTNVVLDASAITNGIKAYVDDRDDILYTMATNRPTRTFFEKDVDWEGNGRPSFGGGAAITTIGTLGYTFRAPHLYSTMWYGAQYAETALRAINADNAAQAARIGAINGALQEWWFGPKDEYKHDGNPNMCFWDTGSGVVLTNAWTRDLPSAAKMKEIAGTALGCTYDDELGITWRKVARNGVFYEVCETNINTAVIQ